MPTSKSPKSSPAKRATPSSAPKSSKRARTADGEPGTLAALFRQNTAAAEPALSQPEKPDLEAAAGSAVASPAPDEAAPASAASASDAAAPVPLTTAEEAELRAFDLEMKFGPLVGPSRVARWQRAQRFRLDPPPSVLSILDRLPADHPAMNSIWQNHMPAVF